MVMNVRDHLYKFLREGDDQFKPPGPDLKLELGLEEHEYLASVISAWFERKYELKKKDT